MYYSHTLMKKNIHLSFFILILAIVIFNFDVINYINDLKEKLGDYYYPLDDSYIHLSIAKNISFHEVWGITRYEFSSTSSSPFFSILLSILMNLWENNPLVSLYLNIFIANLFLIIIYLYFKDEPIVLASIFTGLYFIVLLKIQTVTGLEHVLHISFIAIFWLSLFKWIESNYLKNNHLYLVYLSSFFLIISRYESLFLLFPAIIFLLIKKRNFEAITILILSLIPVISFGLFSIKKGGFFFPNSLLVKGNLSLNPFVFFQQTSIIGKIIIISIILFLITIIFLNFTLNKKTKKELYKKSYNILLKNDTFLIIFITIILHSLFAKFNWLYRYESYLLTLIIVSVPLFFKKNVTNYTKRYYLATILLIFAFFTPRFLQSEKDLEFSAKNIYSQQVQIGMFLQKNKKIKTVIANDIGAICYFSDVKIIDLMGLGSTNILILKKNNPEQYKYYLNHVNYDLMVIYDSWFSNDKMKTRVKIAELKNLHHQVYGDNKVSFYIPQNSNLKKDLLGALKNFKKQLPKDTELIIYN